jgi:NAD/NADP transhydrogenase beta subunit
MGVPFAMAAAFVATAAVCWRDSAKIAAWIAAASTEGTVIGCPFGARKVVIAGLPPLAGVVPTTLVGDDATGAVGEDATGTVGEDAE